jgi:hypothetical protein
MRTKLRLLHKIILSSLLSLTLRNRARLRALSKDTSKDLVVFAVSPGDFNTPSKSGLYPDKVFSLHKIVIEMGLRSEIIFHPWMSISRNRDFIRVLRIERLASSFKKFWAIQVNQFDATRDKEFRIWWRSISLVEKYQFSVWSDFLDKTNPKIVFGIGIKESLIQGSKLKNIPVVEVMHGVFTNESIPLQRYSRGSHRIMPVDLFLSWDSHYSNLIQSVNIPTRTLGHPNGDYSTDLTQKSNLSDGNVLVTLSWGVENSMDPYGMLHLSLAEKLLQSGQFISKIVFRLHPVAFEQNREGMNQVAFWFKRNFPESSLSTPDKMSLFNELSSASLHITEESSTFYEAGLLGVPTVFTSAKAYKETPQEYKDNKQIHLWSDFNDLDLITLVGKKRVISGCKLDRELFKEVIYSFQNKAN